MQWLLNQFCGSGLRLDALATESALWLSVGPRKLCWSCFPLVKSFSRVSNYYAGRTTNEDLGILTASPSHPNSIFGYLPTELYMVSAVWFSLAVVQLNHVPLFTRPDAFHWAVTPKDSTVFRRPFRRRVKLLFSFEVAHLRKVRWSCFSTR